MYSAIVISLFRASSDAIRGGADKILFADPKPELNGKTLADVAGELELSPAAAAQEVLRDGNVTVMNLDLYDNENTRRLAQEPWMMTCTDGVSPDPDAGLTHPRAYGGFPKKVELYVDPGGESDDGLITMAFAIRSFSGLAADFLDLTDRGYVREGLAADVVVLNRDGIAAPTTYEDPHRMATGVEHLFLNGERAIADGEVTGALAGRPLLRGIN